MIAFLFMLAFSANGGIILISAIESYNCNFETGFCSWRQPSDDDFDWFRGTSIPTKDIGPTGDGGNFAYIETACKDENNKARLVSGIIEPTDEANLQLAVHMFGAKMSTFKVYLQHICERDRQTSIFNKTGVSMEGWMLFYQQFKSSTPFIIVIEGSVGPAFTGDIAIDDILFSSVPLVKTTQTKKPTTTTSMIETTSEVTATVPQSSPRTTTVLTSSPRTTTVLTSSPRTTTVLMSSSISSIESSSSKITTTVPMSPPITTNTVTISSTRTTSAPKLSPRTTTVPKSSETVDMSMVIIDDAYPKLNDPKQSENLVAILFDALMKIFNHIPGFLRTEIYSVESHDTTIVHFGVTIDRGVSSSSISLALAIEEVAMNGQITINNTQYRISDIQLKRANEKSVYLSTKSDVCIVRQAVFPCDSGHVCDIIEDLPICVQQKQSDRHLIVALLISIPIVIISAFALLLIFCTRKRKKRTSTRSSRLLNDGQLSRIDRGTRHSSWHRSLYNNPTYFYDEASSSRNESEKNRNHNNQYNTNGVASMYERHLKTPSALYGLNGGGQISRIKVQRQTWNSDNRKPYF